MKLYELLDLIGEMKVEETEVEVVCRFKAPYTGSDRPGYFVADIKTARLAGVGNAIILELE